MGLASNRGGATRGPPKRWRRAVREWDRGPPPAAPVSTASSTVRLAAASGPSARQARARAAGQPSRGATPPPRGPPVAGRRERAAPARGRRGTSRAAPRRPHAPPPLVGGRDAPAGLTVTARARLRWARARRGRRPLPPCMTVEAAPSPWVSFDRGGRGVGRPPGSRAGVAGAHTRGAGASAAPSSPRLPGVDAATGGPRRAGGGARTECQTSRGVDLVVRAGDALPERGGARGCGQREGRAGTRRPLTRRAVCARRCRGVVCSRGCRGVAARDDGGGDPAVRGRCVAAAVPRTRNARRGPLVGRLAAPGLALPRRGRDGRGRRVGHPAPGAAAPSPRG